MTRKKWFLILALVFLGWSLVIGGLVKLVSDKKAAAAILEKFPDRGVPRINIELNGVSLEEINAGSKEVKYEGNELSIYDGGEALDYDGVEVKGRGNGTWAQEKKPYQIKFNKKVDLFGMGKARRWVLLANAMDRTNIRTEVATYLEEMLGMEYILTGKFVELYVGEEYEGLYYLTHAVEIDKTSVDLRDPLGVLVEMDNIYGSREENYYLTGNGDYMILKDVVVDNNKEAAMASFMTDYNEFEVAVKNGDYERMGELLDLDSLAKYYLLSEFSVNPDAYWTSFYFYKDGVDDKIHVGPGWDFDLTFGNRSWGNWMGDSFYSPTQTMVRRGELLPKEDYESMGLIGVVDWYKMSLSLSKIVYDVMEIPEFQDKVAAMYKERMSGRVMELLSVVSREAEKIENVASEDRVRWGEGDVGGELEEMKKWIWDRYNYFEQEYGGGDIRNSVT